MNNLHDEKIIQLFRFENGWLLRKKDAYESDPRWVFESTESLCEQLPEIIGQSGWRVMVNKKETPARGDGGRFLPKTP
jgi:hypothetical protein